MWSLTEASKLDNDDGKFNAVPSDKDCKVQNWEIPGDKQQQNIGLPQL